MSVLNVNTVLGEMSYHRFKYSKKYSSPRLVVDRMEELIAELLLVENVWCQKQSWSFMYLLCSGMVGFGLRRNLGTTEKEHPTPTLPPPKVGEVLLLYFSQTASRWYLSLSLMKSASTSPTIGGGRGGAEGCSFSTVPKFRRRPKPTIPLHSKFINDQLCF